MFPGSAAIAILGARSNTDHVLLKTSTSASAVSTGTHGKNVKCGTLSSIVQSMTLVLADGSIKNICLRDEQGCYSKEPLACAGE